jgi:hypothetical protein
MADKGIAHLSSSIFPDDVKSALNGNLGFDVATIATGTHKWVYCTKAITTSAAIFTDSNDYFDGAACHDNDIAKYVVIKHTGTSDGEAITKAGLMIGLDGTNDYNTADNIFLEPGEMITLKLPFTTINNLKAVAVTITNGKPAVVAGTVQLTAAAILDDVA